ncbi:YihY/virulence factor BrkB family protein [Aquimarina sp. MMG015]|uniref:YihY/virulence factor BrkB family protein n=1 Tax=unclassified Aquimarina TaxID=2627091 RepID=UPI000E545D6D|nr:MULTISPECIES: YihY/virulence factor BrkB family protein [unclassified Aquimarina]AXT55540.1 YihY/virulence factor BrkB family protein [Aquimarina sp. AD1]MBQ4802520.1 YihY/virulence factor BrkB family protein [Aquimarina sp. MMG015]
MSKAVEDKLNKIPIINILVKIGKKVILPGFEGLSVYDLVEIYAIGIVKGTFSARASAISWSFFLSLFPFLLFLLNLIPIIQIDGFQENFFEFITSALPNQSKLFFEEIYTDISANPRTGLLSTVFILSLFLMTNGINAVFSGFEYSYHVTLNRNFVKQYIVALGVSLIVASLLLITVIVTLYFSYLLEDLKEMGVMDNTVFWLQFGKYGLFVLMIFLVVATLFYFGTTEGKMNRFFSPGAFMTTVLIVVTTYLFGVYIDNFSNYNKLYGSIGAMLILMVYIWLNANLLLLGFELNASLIKLKKNF